MPYDLDDPIAPYAQIMDGWRTTPPPSGIVPCDEGVDWALSFPPNTTFQQAIRRGVEQAEDPDDPVTKKDIFAWYMWQIETPDADITVDVRVEYIQAIVRIEQNQPARMFRLWLITPRAWLTQEQEDAFRALWEGKLPRAEAMLARGEFTRAN